MRQMALLRVKISVVSPGPPPPPPLTSTSLSVIISHHCIQPSGPSVQIRPYEPEAHTIVLSG